MAVMATPFPAHLQVVAEPTEDERWAAWRARGVVQDARSTRHMRVVMAVIIALGIAAASVVLR